MLDRQRRKIGKPFEVDGKEILYPGHPLAVGELIYNCRCTITAALEGVDMSNAMRRVRDPVTGRNVLVKDMSYKEWEAAKRGKGAGSDNSDRNAVGKPIQVGTVDFADKQSVLSRLVEAEKELSGLEYEVNYSITADGKVWRVTGEAGSVDPSGIPSSLKGAYSYHNHPALKTNYSFSAADVAFFIDSGEAVSIASDDEFEYVMVRQKETLDKNYDEIYYRFKEIENTEVLGMLWNREIDPDLDRYHAVMEILKKELNIGYERNKKN